MKAPSPRGNRDDQQMSCKVCGVILDYDFDVPDIYWTTVVPEHLQDRVICAGCFHRFALASGTTGWEDDSK